MLLKLSARAASALVLSVAAALGPAGCANQPVDPYGMAPPPDATLPPACRSIRNWMGSRRR